MKIRILSDLHFETLPREFRRELPHVEADLLVIAGDYHRARLTIPHARAQFPKIPLVIVAGNHEHYRTGYSVSENIAQLRKDAQIDREANGNVTHFLENDTVTLNLTSGEIRIIGATLWTDFRIFDTPAKSMRWAQANMNDFLYINSDRKPGTGLRPIETVNWHQASRRFIEHQLKQSFAGPTIVLTHHLPSILSVSTRYRSGALTPAFASNCDDLIALGPDVWIHGHTHDSCDYRIGKTRIICNPHGYSAGVSGSVPENKNFDPRLVVE
ncbi:MAG: hypothetical protein B7Z71_00495 [Acidocella sp. 21-58-7]|nr:MAG: hypothetical protein B7Z71_00495 [Acidocella sp. 21-58-7]HQT65800.1 metallophosphoesterase [Acidocella sp.]